MNDDPYLNDQKTPKHESIMRMDKYGRELDLILLLTDNNRYTAQQLADKLGITRRNLYYYLEYLRTCGFRLIKSGVCYRLDRNVGFLRRLRDNVTLSEDEAAYICKQLDAADHDGYLSRTVRAKLARTFNLADDSTPEIVRRVDRNLSALRRAVAEKRMVTLHEYSSPHSATVTDRIVEPFLLLNEGRDVRCHELRSGVNKTFKLARIGSVEMLDVPWLHESDHKEVFTDIFMFSGEERHTVTLRLGQLSRNLMLEEFPASAPCLRDEPGGKWLFRAECASLLGVGRFVLGLYHDIEVLGDDAFRAYLAGQIAAMRPPK